MSYPKICKITPEEYQDKIENISKRFKVYGTDNALPTYACDLGEETGEVLGILKRLFREGEHPSSDNLEKELGDVVASIVVICNYFNIDFEAVLLMNIDKLEDRAERDVLEGKGNDR